MAERSLNVTSTKKVKRSQKRLHSDDCLRRWPYDLRRYPPRWGAGPQQDMTGVTRVTLCVCVCLAPWTQLGWQPGPMAQFGVKLDSLARTQLGGWGGGVMPRFKPSCCYSRCLSLLFNHTESQGWSLGGAGNMWLLELFLERRRGGLFIRCVPRSLCSAAPSTYDPPFTVQCIYHMINGKWTAFI